MSLSALQGLPVRPTEMSGGLIVSKSPRKRARSPRRGRSVDRRQEADLGVVDSEHGDAGAGIAPSAVRIVPSPPRATRRSTSAASLRHDFDARSRTRSRASPPRRRGSASSRGVARARWIRWATAGASSAGRRWVTRARRSHCRDLAGLRRESPPRATGSLPVAGRARDVDGAMPITAAPAARAAATASSPARRSGSRRRRPCRAGPGRPRTAA